MPPGVAAEDQAAGWALEGGPGAATAGLSPPHLVPLEDSPISLGQVVAIDQPLADQLSAGSIHSIAAEGHSLSWIGPRLEIEHQDDFRVSLPLPCAAVTARFHPCPNGKRAGNGCHGSYLSKWG